MTRNFCWWTRFLRVAAIFCIVPVGAQEISPSAPLLGEVLYLQVGTIQTSGYESALHIRTLLRLRVSIPRWLESPIIRANQTLLPYLAVKMRQHFWRYVGFRF